MIAFILVSGRPSSFSRSLRRQYFRVGGIYEEQPWNFSKLLALSQTLVTLSSLEGEVSKRIIRTQKKSKDFVCIFVEVRNDF